jgi:hypothetical protein
MFDNRHSLLHIIDNKNKFINVRVYMSDQDVFLHVIDNETGQKFKTNLKLEDTPSLKVFNSPINLFKIMSKLSPDEFILK